MKPLQRIIITGGAGQVAYSLLFQVAQGHLLGKDQPIALHLLDLPDMQKQLEGVALELEDCAFPLLKEIRVGSDPMRLFEGVHFALLLGAKPRTIGMERKDLLAANGHIFYEQGQAINEAASRDVRVFVVGNPCNTNCLIALHNAPDLSYKQFFALTRLDQNRAQFQLSKKAKTDVSEVSNVAIWGNHSATQVVDFLHAKIKHLPVSKTVNDRRWLEGDFSTIVQKRGTEVMNLRGRSSAASAAKAVIDAVRSILEPTKIGTFFSMGVYSKGNPYGIDENLVFSFPCRSKGKGDVEIVRNLKFDDFLEEKIAITQKELIEERSVVSNFLKRHEW